MPRTASLLRRERPNLARLVRRALNRASLLEGPLTDRIAGFGNAASQGQLATPDPAVRTGHPWHRVCARFRPFGCLPVKESSRPKAENLSLNGDDGPWPRS
jgi:hypothetical protein